MPVISKITGAPFRFWCQKILPAVYDDSLSYYELLCKVVDYLNKVMEDDINVVNLVNELEEFVNNYFNNLDVQQEINNKLDAMAEDGSLLAVVAPHLDDIIGQYEATLDADLAEYKETIDADVGVFKVTVNTALSAQDTDIANFKNTVNGQVSAQNTEIANFKTNVNTTVAGQDNDIYVMQSQMENFIQNHSGELTFTELYSTTEALGAHNVNETFDLTDDYTKYTELDIYWSYNSVQRCTRVKTSDLLATGVEISFYADEAVSQSNVAPMFFPFMKIVNGNSAHTQLKIGSAYAERWSGAAADSASRNVPASAADYSAGSIIKVVGISYQLDSEVLDIRVGANSTEYPTAGDAVRGQYSDLKSKLDTIQTVGNTFNLIAAALWEVGSISTQNGENVSALNRIRTKNYIDVSNCTSVTLSVESGYKYAYILYNANREMVAEQPPTGPWFTTPKTLLLSDSVQYIRLLVSNTSDSAADLSFATYMTASYTTPWNEFNDTIKNIITLSLELPLTLWVNKSVSTTDGTPFYSTARICTANYVDISLYNSITVSPESGYKAYIYYYDSNYGYLNGTQSGWISTEKTVIIPSNAAYALIVIANINDTTINTSEYTNVSFSYSTALIDAIEDNRTDIISLNSGFSEKALQARRPINSTPNGYTSEPTPLSLLWFSDIHGNAVNLQRIVDFKDKYSTYFDDVVCTGDLVPNRASEGMSFWNSVNGAENILLCIGNHDALADPSGYDWSQLTTQAEQYAEYIAPYYTNWGLSSSVSSGLTYWYKDYAENGIRLISLNCMLTGSDDVAQQEWFQDALSGAKADGYTVVIMTHCPLQGAVVIPSNWTNRDRNTINDYLNAAYKGYVDTFKGDGGKFACWITGHMHWDFLSKYTGTNGDQLVLTIDATDVFQSNYYSDIQRTNGTKTQDLANAIFIDTSSQCVKVIRIGANEDHYLRPRNILSVSFDGTIIAQE